MEDILVGVDGSPASLGALTVAASFAGLSGARLHVARVVPPDTAAAEAAGDEGGAPHVEARRWCESAGLERDPEVVVLVGEPGAALLDAADRRRVDLVVVGTEGTLGRSGPRFGSVANLLAHRLDMAFLAVPVGVAWHGLRRVVMGVDGSEGSDAAVAFVAGIPRLEQVEVTVLFDSQPLTGWKGGPVPEALRQRAVHDLDLWTMPLERAGATVSRRVVDDGHPSLAMLGAADEVQADLVVAGAQPTNRLTSTRAGSTVFQILHKATRPTLLVPPPSSRR